MDQRLTSPDGRRRLLPKRGALAVGILLLSALLTTQQVSAQEEKSGPEHSSADPQSPSAEPQAVHDAPHEHRHEAGLFIGGSHSDGENGFTFGGEYEFIFHQYFGAGGFVEFIGGDFDERAFGALLYLRPAGKWRIFTGPGGDKRFGEEQHSDPSAEGTEEGWKFLWRLGLIYAIPVGSRITISPNVMVDFLEDNQVFVYGVTFSLGI